MQDKNSIISFNDYGYIDLNIKSLMQKHKITKSQIIKRTGLHHQIVERYINNTVTRYDKDILARFCYVFNCDIFDIIKYIKPKK